MNTEDKKCCAENDLTEYQAIQQWRNSVVNNDFIMTSIFIPLSIIIFSTYFLIEKASPSIKLYLALVFLVASVGLLLMWRIYAYHIDKRVLDIYPRICELEKNLQYQFTNIYLKNCFFPEKMGDESWLPSGEEMKKRLDELGGREKFETRGHDKLNNYAMIIVLFEFIALFFYNVIIQSTCTNWHIS